VGLVNALVGDPLASDDEMTMRMIELGTTVPYPGKLGLERRIAASELAEAEAGRDHAERNVVAAVARTYYQIYFIDRRLEVVERNRLLLADLVTLTEVRYGVGLGAQQDVLTAQVERAHLGEEVLALAARRAASAARLNALLDRPPSAPLEPTVLPERVLLAAVPAPGLAVRFTAAALDAEPADTGPLPGRDALQRLAADHSPELRAAAARVESQRQRAALANKAALPDLDVSAGYGQRSGRPDMLTLMASVPLPLFRGRKQDALTAAAAAELRQLEAARDARQNDLQAQVAALHAGLVRTRQQIALFREGILPQAHAAFESALAGYPVDRVDFLTLLNSQVTLFRHDLDYDRLLADFARDLAELERIAGTEVL
ncbi:MAG: TolC family protein, partial [Gemmatimonadota bacterium]